MEKRCMGCMRPKLQSPLCEHCGFDERSDNLPHQLPIGTVLHGQYLVGRVMGQGGFGITYLGWDRNLAVKVAIKEYFPNGMVQRNSRLGTQVRHGMGKNPELFEKHRERFLKEARMLAQFTDVPEIVHVKNYFAENGTAYIVMEFVEGITLKQYMARLGRPLQQQEMLELVKPLLSALEKVHAKHLIHRDISPDNIMLTENGGIKLIDFGAVRDTVTAAFHSTEAVIKPGFAPLEQYNTRGSMGPWTDVYALCASFCYLLTGKVPPDVHERAEDGEALWVLRNSQVISPRLAGILEEGMKLRPSERIQSVEELYRLLYDPQAKLPEAPDRSPAADQPSVTVSPNKRSFLWLIPVCIVVMLLAGMFLLQDREGSAQPLQPGPAEPAADPAEERYRKALSLMESGQYEEARVIFLSLGDYRDSRSYAKLCRLEQLYLDAQTLEEEKQYPAAAIAFGKLGSHRDARERSFALWKRVPNRQLLTFWENTFLAPTRDGTLMADSPSGTVTWIQEEAYTGLVSLHGCVGLKCDGTLALPSTLPPFDEMALWQDLVAVSGSGCCYVGLTAEGRVVCAGFPDQVAAGTAGWRGICAVSCSPDHIAALTSEGKVLCAGSNGVGQCDTENWSNVIDIAVCEGVTMGLRSDGTVLSAGTNRTGARSAANQWVNVVELTEGPFAIMGNGTVAAGFDSADAGTGRVKDWKDIVAVAAGPGVCAGLRTDGTLIFTNPGRFPNAARWQDLQIP